MFDTSRYLARIGYAGPREPTLATLRAVHEAHLRAVPFENLDIARGVPIVLDEATICAKIVGGRRGGFCYELNGLFAALLRALGFRVTLLSARDIHPVRGLGPEFDHLALRVDLDEPWLADVGWGDSFLQPLRLDITGEQLDAGHTYRIVHDGDYRTLQRREQTGAWEDNYRFTLQPRAWADFAAMCHYHQTSPDSAFTQHNTCTLPTARGRVTVSDRRLIITEDGTRRESTLADDAAVAAALREQFGIVLG